MTEPALAESVKGYGRMYRHPVNDALYPSVTNVIDVLAKPWLGGWAAREVAGYAYDQRFALMKMEERDAAVDFLKGAPYRNRNRAAAIGDLIHEYAEAVASDIPAPEIPEELETHVEPFLTFLDEYKPRFLVLEGCIFRGGPDDEDRFAGSFDFLADIAGFNILGDYKSGARIYDEVALQLGALRRGDELWDEKTGDLMPMPAVDGCVGVHLRPGKLAVHLIDAGDEAFRAFLGLRGAWPWNKEHTGAIGPRLNLERLVKELRKPDTLLQQLEQSVEETSGGELTPESPATGPATSNEVATSLAETPPPAASATRSDGLRGRGDSPAAEATVPAVPPSPPRDAETAGAGDPQEVISGV